MSKFISSLAAFGIVLGVSASGAFAEDLLKKETMETSGITEDAAHAAAAPAAAGNKADCVQKAEAETDATKKADMMKVCDAMQ